MQVSMEYATEASLARLPFKIYIMHSMKQRKCYYDETWFIMVKGLLACFSKVFEVFKSLWSNSEHFVYFVN